VAVAISPSATKPADTEPMNMVARLVDSAMVAARALPGEMFRGHERDRGRPRVRAIAPWAGFASLIIAHHLACDGYGAIIAGKH